MATIYLRFTGFWGRQQTPWQNEDSLESSDALLGEDMHKGQSIPTTKRRRSRTLWILTFLNSVLLCWAIILYLVAWVKYSQRNGCIRATSMYSPVLEEIDMPLKNTLLNGSLWLGDNPPTWRGLPDSDKVNEAWDSFEDIRPIVLTREQIVAMGKDPATVAKFDNEYWGLGDDAYVGALDFFHQIHCLNMLRLETFRYWNRQGETVPQWNDIHWIHLQHCVGMLMEHLLCTADAGFLTYNWVEHESSPFPDMSVQRQCRDWHQLIDYRDAHGVNVTKYVEWTKPEGVTELAQPPDWWEHRGERNKAHFPNGTEIWD
ncbi:hypothetical protein F5Y04DRAFT_276044 [Hypomontagnella monticulosa]|nr:hypothetical protein F5Y04DRAFT_276044 [Hypomontagnella monticulosa]